MLKMSTNWEQKFHLMDLLKLYEFVTTLFLLSVYPLARVNVSELVAISLNWEIVSNYKLVLNSYWGKILASIHLLLFAQGYRFYNKFTNKFLHISWISSHKAAMIGSNAVWLAWCLRGSIEAHKDSGGTVEVSEDI